MCGICGIFGCEDVKTCKEMLFVLKHRGPDDEYLVSGKDFTVGARRLSIIDVEGGRQPISNERGKIWVAQNGEIYNFPELRESLLQKGHSLSTRSDTEVLAHLYEDHGENFLQYITGMYAIAIWDDEKKRGILVRDRMGKKPLYYLFHNGSLYFSSEIKSLLLIPGFKREINIEALHYYLSYKHIPCPLSIFKGISQLPPAHLLIFTPDREPTIERYWRLAFTPLEGQVREEEIIEEMLNIMGAAVKRRLISDVPIGFFLSGGIDSGLSTALAARLSSKRIETFTLTYSEEASTPGKRQDMECARRVSQIYDTVHHEETIEVENFPDEFPHIISHFDEPFAGVTSPYFLSRLISKHVKVALSGDGADELFGSYLSHRLSIPIYNYLMFKETGKSFYNNFGSFQKDYVEKIAEKEDWKWRYKLSVFTDEEKARLYSHSMADVARQYSTLSHIQKYFFDSLTANDPLNRILEAEFKSQLPDQVLTYLDRLSMAHSLEVRTAYMDHEFVSFAARIPGTLKIRDGVTKYILKKAALKFLPAEMVYRGKEGFIMPINQWLFQKLEGYVRDTLSEEALKKHGYFNKMYVQQVVNEFYKGKQEHANKILSLIAFEVWYELYMKE